MNDIEKIRKAAENDLFVFANLVNPSYVYGQIHREFFRWLGRPGAANDLLGLLPRGHLKSHCVAVWCAWWITKFPDTTILYVSATEDLALQQLYVIKNILTSDVYRKYWPDMVAPEEAKREEWNVKNIKVDHPLRRARGIRDRTVAARSVGGNTTGLHCDVLVFDDLVVPDNAYTEDGRKGVASAYSQFSSIANPGAISRVVGTRYHGKDIYAQMIGTQVEEFDDTGEVVGSEPMYEIFERRVEEEGNYLWPRQQCPKTNKWFGFDNKELSRIRAKYFAAGERSQYYAQYYNNPNDPDATYDPLDTFQYIDRRHLQLKDDGNWYINNRQLDVYAGADFAYTTGTRSDYTAYAVVGVDEDGYKYVLDLEQFKTNKYDVMYKAALRLWEKWKFKRMRVETNAGANLICEYMTTEFRKSGASVVIDGKKSVGEKNERIGSILLPLYENKTVFHLECGYMLTYEEQIILPRPPHDDLRDAVAAAVEISKPRVRKRMTSENTNVIYDARFGGRRR